MKKPLYSSLFIVITFTTYILLQKWDEYLQLPGLKRMSSQPSISQDIAIRNDQELAPHTLSQGDVTSQHVIALSSSVQSTTGTERVFAKNDIATSIVPNDDTITTPSSAPSSNIITTIISTPIITTTTSSSQLWKAESEKAQGSLQPGLILRIGTEYEYDAFYDITSSRIESRDVAELARLIPNPKVLTCNCNKLFHGDREESMLAEAYHFFHSKIPIEDGAYMHVSSDCELFKSRRKYIPVPLSKDEEDFPIAFSIMVYKDVEQFERLLRAIYQPQNYYCIHVDIKSPTEVREDINAIATCFDNVHISSRSFNVTWGEFSVLEPDLVCMRDLWKYRKWRYFINLAAQEFPLKTNADLVRIMKALHGLNDVDAIIARGSEYELRTRYVHDGIIRTEVRKDRPPAGIRLSKGSMHITATRDFVGYILHDTRALRFQDWVKDTGIPDETYFSTLHSSPELGVPGTYIGIPYTDPIQNPFISRYVNWGAYPYLDWPCHGQWVHDLCVFGTGDLKQLATRPEMFANKLYVDYEPLALDCLEELQFTRMREEVLGTRRLNTTYYEALPKVANAKNRT